MINIYYSEQTQTNNFFTKKLMFDSTRHSVIYFDPIDGFAKHNINVDHVTLVKTNNIETIITILRSIHGNDVVVYIDHDELLTSYPDDDPLITLKLKKQLISILNTMKYTTHISRCITDNKISNSLEFYTCNLFPVNFDHPLNP